MRTHVDTGQWGLTVEETKVPPQSKLFNCVPSNRRFTCEGTSPGVASLPPKTLSVFQFPLLLEFGNKDALLSYFVYSNENGLVMVPHIGPDVGLRCWTDTEQSQ